MNKRVLCSCSCGPLNVVVWLPEKYAKPKTRFYFSDKAHAMLEMPRIARPSYGSYVHWTVNEIYHELDEEKIADSGRLLVPENELSPMDGISD